MIESDDQIEVNGVIFNKPFVEKPLNAEDHNIRIYYPFSAGGGSQRLFRKVRPIMYFLLNQVLSALKIFFESFQQSFDFAPIFDVHIIDIRWKFLEV